MTVGVQIIAQEIASSKSKPAWQRKKADRIPVTKTSLHRTAGVHTRKPKILPFSGFVNWTANHGKNDPVSSIKS